MTIYKIVLRWEHCHQEKVFFFFNGAYASPASYICIQAPIRDKLMVRLILAITKYAKQTFRSRNHGDLKIPV